MIKHDYSEEETVLMRLKLFKLGFLPLLKNLEHSSRLDVSWSHRNVGDDPRQRHDLQVPMSQRGASEPGHIPM